MPSGRKDDVVTVSTSNFFRHLLLLSALVGPISSSQVLESAKKDTLKLVQVLFRHGDRAPTYTYPNDPYNDDISKYWPEGIAQLTNRGKMQQYELGQYLRKRYDGYLGLRYSPKELYVTSSDMDRTIMSLESNLAGLFPPLVPFNPKINWQPIPLRTIPWKEDKLLHNNVRCPRYRKLRQEFFESSEVVTKLNEENKEFIRYCSEKSGLPAWTVKQLYPLFDVLYAQSQHNFTLPEWAQGDLLPRLERLQGIVNTFPTYTDEMKRLAGGSLLHLLLKNMQAITGIGVLGRSSNPENAHSVTSHGENRKMLMYSAHDSTLSRIMNTMGIFEPHCPPYASALLVELHQDPDTLEFFVEIHYRNDTTRPPYLLLPSKCGNPCNLYDLIELYRPLIPTDWESECQLENSRENNNVFVLKMHDHDHEEGAYVPILASSGGSAPSDNSCGPSMIQLVLMGIGLVAITLLVSLLLVKVVESRRRGDNLLYIDHGVNDVLNRPLFVGVLQNKPQFYGGRGGRSSYEKL